MEAVYSQTYIRIGKLDVIKVINVTRLVHVRTVEAVRGHAIVVVHAVPVVRISTPSVVSRIFVVSIESLSSGLSVSLPESPTIKVT